MTPEIKVIYDVGADTDIALPSYETNGAAGADVRANFRKEARAHGMTIEPGQRVLVPTGLRVAIPVGYEIQVRPRSGLALKKGITVANAPGTIDSDYRGPLGVILINVGKIAVTIAHGERVAQLIVAPVVQGAFTIAQHLDETSRGSGGFGSTGVN